MVLLPTVQVRAPPPEFCSLIPSPEVDPLSASPLTPIVSLLNVPVWVAAPVVFTMVRAFQAASRNELPVMFIVVLPPAPSLNSDSPPPPVAMAGWLFEKALLVRTRSLVQDPPWLSCSRSPAADVNVLFWMVALNGPALPVLPSETPSLPPAVLLAPIVVFDIVSRLRDPAELRIRTLSSKPPLTADAVTLAEPVRLSIQTLESSNGVA